MDSIDSFIHQRRGEMVQTLRELIRIPSVRQPARPGMPFGKPAAEALQRMLQICRDAGLQTRCFDNIVGTADWGEQPRLGILTHLDVVPAGDGWTTDPFSATVQNGRVFGRGAIDDKGPAVAALFALLAVIQSGARPQGGVRLIFGTDEENGSSDLAAYCEAEELPPLLFTPDGSYPLINIEKGMLRLGFSSSAPPLLLAMHGSDAVNAVAMRAAADVRADKAQLQPYAAQYPGCAFSFDQQQDGLHIVCTGKAAHASLPETGVNPLTALVELLSHAVPQLKPLADLFPHRDTTGRAAGIACADEESGALSLAFTTLDIKDGRMTGAVDIRFPLCQTLEQLRGVLEPKLKAAGFCVTPLMSDPPHRVPSDSELVRTLLAVYEEQTGDRGECLSIGGGTYVHNLNGVAFGPEFPGQDYHMHGADEYIPVDELLLNAKIMAHAMLRLAAV